jgi:hypothetical protein
VAILIALQKAKDCRASKHKVIELSLNKNAAVKTCLLLSLAGSQSGINY